MLEAGATQATGKAFGLENLISQLETMAGGDDASMADVSLTYYLGEASELWEDVFADSRILFMPPNVCTLLVLFCRNHNV